MLLEFEEGIRSSRAGVTGGYELPSTCAGKWARVLWFMSILTFSPLSNQVKFFL